jgi:hypothetical protein
MKNSRKALAEFIKINSSLVKAPILFPNITNENRNENSDSVTESQQPKFIDIVLPAAAEPTSINSEPLLNRTTVDNTPIDDWEAVDRAEDKSVIFELNSQSTPSHEMIDNYNNNNEISEHEITMKGEDLFNSKVESKLRISESWESLVPAPQTQSKIKLVGQQNTVDTDTIIPEEKRFWIDPSPVSAADST